MNIIDKINKIQNKNNCFSDVSIEDLKNIILSIDAMCYFGYKRKKAENIVIIEYLNGNKNYKNENLVYSYLMNK